VGNQKILPYVFFPIFTYLVHHLRIVQEMMDAEGSPFHRVYSEPSDTVDELNGDSTRETPDDGFPLPHGFRHGQAKTLPQGFL
jgi:hypothetical protein